MLRKDFSTHVEFSDEIDSESGAKKSVMEFYLSMMKREIYISDKTQESHLFDHDSDNDKLVVDDGKHCYPLCEKRFLDNQPIRYISPCGHGFHEKCI